MTSGTDVTGATGMRKFSCTHCGQRLAVPPRHLGRLVTCPECGRETHPLAEQILSLSGAGRASATPTTPNAANPAAPAPGAAPVAADPSVPATTATCANCGQTIGRLQKLNLWDNSI